MLQHDNKNQSIFLKMVLSVSLFIIAVYWAWWFCSPKPVITSKAGNISQGTLSYINFVFYSDKSHMQMLEDLKEDMAIGYLADGLGLREDPYYSKFLAISLRSRIQRAAIEWLKYKNKTMDIDIDIVFKQYGIESDPQQATKLIQSCIQREKHGFRLKCQDVIVGQIQNKPLHLTMIKMLMTPEEWYQFISFLPTPMENAYTSYLTRFLYYIVHKDLIEYFSPVIKELKQMDHDQVARRYISVKYGMAQEGVYPSHRLNLDFPDTVLFNHFFAIKHRFLPVQTVQVQYSVFESMDIAKMVYNKLKNGENLISLAKQYAINDLFVQTAYPHRLSGYGVNGMSSNPDQRAIIDNYLLDAARKNILLPQPHKLDQGVLVAQLSQLERQQRELKYREYQFAVKRDLTLKTLKEKFRIDVEDATNAIQWKQINHDFDLVTPY